MSNAEIDIERERVACVFGLGGGELHLADERFPDEWDGPTGIAFWYDGPPSYSEMKNASCVTCATCEGSKVDPADGDSECPNCEGMGYLDREVRTTLLGGVYGLPPAPEGWEQLAVFMSSGEAECWHCGPGSGNETEHDGCKLCGGGGYVYIGEGHCEVVYRRLP